MSWRLSRFRAGDIVDVRSIGEILATLDQDGCLDGMPFMPEMVQYCGKRFRVGAVAHKTCDMVGELGTCRRLQATVHLAGLRCDGLAHGGCQAECNLFWKDEWLSAVGDDGRRLAQPGSKKGEHVLCTEAQLMARTRQAAHAPEEELRYSCQATRMYRATQPLAWWDARQYIFDVVTGNHSARRVLRVLILASLRRILPRVPIGYRIAMKFNDWMHLWLSGRPSPSLNAGVPDGVQTPTGRQDFRRGDYVRVKLQKEIEQTLNQKSRNRGLLFDAEEMAPYCGRVFKVRQPVTDIIEEQTGRMLRMKEPCIMLDGVVCKAEYARNRLNCPRAIPSFWREIWLERVEDAQRPNGGPAR